MSRFELINVKGVVDSGNSSIVPLSGGATFTGDAFETLNYGIVFVSVYADVASATDGLKVQQSIDGTNWDFADNYTIAAGANENYAVNPHARYLRVVYTNGGSAQTTFRLQVIAKGNSKPSSHRLEDNVTTQDDAELNKTILAYRRYPDELYTNVNVYNPLPVDGDSVFCKDIIQSESDMGNFNGVPSDLIGDNDSTISDTTANNPKEIILVFNRTIITTILSIGAYSGDFSNVKIDIVLPDDTLLNVIDDSADGTKMNYHTYNFPFVAGFHRLKLSFATTDTVSLSYMFIPVLTYNISRLQAVKPDNTVVDINATNGGNLKISLEEIESGISSNSNSQLNVTPYLSNGNEGIAAADSASIDAFGRWRVSNIQTIFDSKQTGVGAQLYWDDQEVSGGGTGSSYSENEAATTLSVSNTTAGKRVRQSKLRFNYQPGKALGLDEPVLTDEGYKSIREIKIGDIVFDGKGEQTEVIQTATWEDRPLYRITFDDGTWVDADGEHDWVTTIRQNSKKGQQRIVTTQQMLEEYGEEPPQFARWRIPAAPVLNIKYKEVPLDPYTLGVILGDGSIDKKNEYVVLTCADEEILNYLTLESVKYEQRDFSYGLKGSGEKIRALGLSGKKFIDKFIPKGYLFNSEDVRLDILRGLMDTDGTVDKKDGCCEFNSASKQLAEDVAFIVRSLGGQAKIRQREAGYYNKFGDYVRCADSFRVRVIISVNPFRLKRKAVLWKKRERISFDRYIHTIKYLGQEETKCIQVASNEHTFLTRNNIVTHNSQLILLTFNMLGGATGIIKQVGYFDDQNGMFLQNDEGTINLVRRTYVSGSAVDNAVAQASWNIDTFDGNGPSGVTLDFTKVQILFMDFEWLGVGRVRMGFVVDGKIYYAHEMDHANVITTVYMSKPNLPIRYTLENDGTGAADEIDAICCSVNSEGGVAKLGATRAKTNGNTGLVVTSSALRACIGLRLKTTELDANVLLETISIISRTINDSFRWELQLNPTVAGTFTYSSVDAYSAVEAAIGATANTVTSGIILASGVGKDNANVEVSLDLPYSLGSDISGTPDEIVLVIYNYTASATIDAALGWRELL